MTQKNNLTIKIYTTKSCGYCFLAKNLLERNNYNYKEIDVSGREDIRQKMTKLSNGLRTVPQIFIGEKHIGGFNELKKLSFLKDKQIVDRLKLPKDFGVHPDLYALLADV